MPLDFGQNKEFDLARERAKQQESANLKTQKDAMARRAAQLGGGPSGAFIKQEQLASQESAKRLADAHEGINAMQAQEQRRLNEIEQAQKFQTSERVGSQDFAAQQAKLGREFSTAERLGAQEFSKAERLGSQEFAASAAEIDRAWRSNERSAGEKFAADQNALARALSESQFLQNLDFSKQQFGWQQQVDTWNKDLADRIQAQNEAPSTMDRVLGVATFGALGSTKGLPGAGKIGSAKKTLKKWGL